MRHLIASLPFGLGACASVNAAERAIDKEVFIDASVDQVWEAWTTKTGITSFFAPDAEIDPRVGGAFHVFINPYADPGLKGADTMQYLALQPKTMLSFDWNAPPSLPNVRNQHTVVILRFAPDGSKTRLTLHHLGSGSADGADGKEWDDAYRYVYRAWGAVLANLQKRFASDGQPDVLDRMAERMKESVPAK